MTSLSSAGSGGPATKFMRALLGEEPPGELVLWLSSRSGRKQSVWTNLSEFHKHITTEECDVYFSVCPQSWPLAKAEYERREAAKPVGEGVCASKEPDQRFIRGFAVTAISMPAVWVDIDCMGGKHASNDLPTQEEARAFLNDMCLPPSAIVHSGGGLHAYWFLDSPIEIIGVESRDSASTLITGFQAWVRRHFLEHGWTLDSTADLARVLRLPGTLNHKSGDPAPVTLKLCNADVRYSVAEVPTHQVQGGMSRTGQSEIDENVTGEGIGGDADLDLIVHECAWVKHCRDDAAILPEPEWYTVLSIQGRCAGGEQAAHEWSKAHPGYVAEETGEKLRRAVSSAGPRTCRNIEEMLGSAFCKECVHRGQIKSPIVLGRKDGLPASRKRVEEVIEQLGAGEVDVAYEPQTLDAADVVRFKDSALHARLTTAIRSSSVLIGEWTDARKTRRFSRRAAASEARRATSTMPRIERGERQLRDVFDDARRALASFNRVDPRYFVFGGALVRVVAEKAGAAIRTVTSDYFYGELSRVADWVVPHEDGDHDSKPDRDASVDIVERPPESLPVLHGISRVPFFDTSGRLVRVDGYDDSTGVYVDARELGIINVPASPTSDDVQTAIAVVENEILFDVRFGGESDRAHYYGALLTPIVRHLFTGLTPLHVFESPTPGSGRGLLASIVGILATGRLPNVQTIAKDDDEMRKRVTSELASGNDLHVLDNLSEKQVLDSPVLASVLTAPYWTDRILGHTRMLQLENGGLWILTANNPRLSVEISRRSVHVRIDPGTDQPWLRKGFRHADLPGWVLAHRARVIEVLLTIVKSWIVAGQPAGKETLGSYDPWARTLGGILAHADITGFLVDRQRAFEVNDDDRMTWRPFIAAWWERHGGARVRSAELVELCDKKGFLGGVLGDGSARSQQTRMGNELRQRDGRSYDGLRIVVVLPTSGSRGCEYRVERNRPDTDGRVSG